MNSEQAVWQEFPESRAIPNRLKDAKTFMVHPRDLLERVCLEAEQEARVLNLGNFKPSDTSQNRGLPSACTNEQICDKGPQRLVSVLKCWL